MFELSFSLGAVIIIIAFFSEFIDSSLGMGYGTLLTPILLIMGFQPLQVVPAVLFSEAASGILAGIFHHSFGNVDLSVASLKDKSSVATMVKTGVSKDLKVVLVISSLSVLGTLAAVLLAVNLKTSFLKLYIGVLITCIGIFILITRKMHIKFSWKRLSILGLIASFNKGMSGGGYGPLVTGGQILSGVDNKNAIGITSLAEGITCVVGVILYYLTKKQIEYTILPYILIGAILSVPLSAFTVKKINGKHLRLIIGIVTLGMGILTFIKAL